MNIKKLVEVQKTNPEKADKEMRTLIAFGLHSMYVGELESDIAPKIEKQNKISMPDYVEKYAGQLKLRKELLNFVSQDKETMKVNLYGNKNTLWDYQVCTDRDLAAMHYLELFETMKDVYAGKNISRNMSKAQKTLGSFLYMQSSLRISPKGPKPVFLRDLGDYYKKSEEFANDMIKCESLPDFSKGQENEKKIYENLGKIEEIARNYPDVVNKVKAYQKEKAAQAANLQARGMERVK